MLGRPSTSELSGPREQLGVLGRGHLRWVDIWWICWLKRQTHLTSPIHGEPDPMALCHPGGRVGSVGRWQPFPVANLSLSDELVDSGEWRDVTIKGQPLEDVLRG